LIAGHYEGFDERIRIGLAPLELSIGDYVLSGGESAAMVVVDAVVRLLPGALGHEDSVREESFSYLDRPAAPGAAESETARRLEYPQYTRPRDFRGMAVPDVLISGDHAKIKSWRAHESAARTRQRRPDLLAGRDEYDE
jgi:tRNA (guanine37-N1)-methyltransferase